MSAWFNEAQRFRLSLLVWRGVQTATPLLLAYRLDDAAFNRFAAMFTAIQVLAGVIGFGQSQFSYSSLHGHTKRPTAHSIDPLVVKITSAVLAAGIVVLWLLPWPLVQTLGWPRIGLALAAHALMTTEILATQALVAGNRNQAVRFYLISAACYIAFLLPLFASGNPDLLTCAGLAGLFTLAWLWRWREASTKHNSGEIALRLRFGTTQTAIMLLSGAVPLLLHSLLPVLGIALKGSKYIIVFSTLSGIAIFIGQSAVVAASASIAAQAMSTADRGINSFIKRNVWRTIPVAVATLFVERALLGTWTPWLAVAVLCQVVAQMTISHIRYVLFAHQVLSWDLWANLLPFVVVASALALLWYVGWLPGDPLVPVAVLTALAVLSALTYRLGLHQLARVPKTPPGTDT